MVQLVGNPVIFCRACLSRENLYIIVCRFTSATCFRTVEALSANRHNINIYLAGTAILAGSPGIAAIDRRPLVRDVCTVLCGNGYLADISAGSAVGMFFLPTSPKVAPIVMRMLLLPAGVIRIIQIERNGILIALVVHIHNGAAVTGDGLLGNGLGREATIALGSGTCLLAGGEIGRAHV